MNNINESVQSIINIDSLPEISAPIRKPRSEHLYDLVKNDKLLSKSQGLMKLVSVNNVKIRNGELSDTSGGIRYLDDTKTRFMNLVQENQVIASLPKEEKARKLQASINLDESVLKQLEHKKKTEAEKACRTYTDLDNLNRKFAGRSKLSQKHLISFKMAGLAKKAAKQRTSNGTAKSTNNQLHAFNRNAQWLTRALSSNNDSSSDSSHGNSRSTSRQSDELAKDEDIDSCLVWNTNKTLGRLPHSGIIYEKNEFGMTEMNTLAMTKLKAVYNEKIDKTDYLPRMKPANFACGHSFSTECFDYVMQQLMNSDSAPEINGRQPHAYFSNEIRECIGALIQNANNNCRIITQNDIEQALINSQLADRIKTSDDFDWARFIAYYKSKKPNIKLAPPHLFINRIPSIPLNTFEIGQKLEAIDPQNECLFCICTVVDKCGHRLKLRFDNYSPIYDFWVSSDSTCIFPAGFCNRTGRKLEYPGRMTTARNAPQFDWKEYLKQTNTSPVHRACFTHLNNAKTNMNPFKKDMKFEAELKNAGKICAATVGDVIDSRVLVKLDSYNETDNFWTDITSPYIHPIRWHSENGFPIQIAPDRSYKSLQWNEYLRKNRAEAVPKSAFCMRQPLLFEAGMALEVVDRKNPNLIRPAIITDVKDFKLKILYIGWPERFAYWVRDDSNDIFPPHYCRRTNHPIECPLDEVYAGPRLKCVRGCRGIGNAKYPDRSNHTTIDECPYEDKHFRIDQSKLLPHRMERKPRINNPINHGVRSIQRLKPYMGTENAQLSLQPVLSPVELAAMAQKDVELFRRLQVSANFLMDNMGPLSEAHQKWINNLEPSNTMSVSIRSENPLNWSVQKVAEFVSALPNCSEISVAFVEHEIDGVALLSLRQDDMIDVMGLSLGLAIKIFNRISFLREECNAKYIQYE